MQSQEIFVKVVAEMIIKTAAPETRCQSWLRQKIKVALAVFLRIQVVLEVKKNLFDVDHLRRAQNDYANQQKE